MKRTRKLILALVVVMSLLMAMAVAIIPASAMGPDETWTVAGSSASIFGSTWAPSNAANDMKYDSVSNVYYKIYTNVPSGSIQFKVCKNHGWNPAYPSNNKSHTVAKSGSVLIITINANTEVHAFSFSTLTVAGSGSHLVNEWDPSASNNNMTYSNGVWTKVYTGVSAGTYEFKIVGDNDWNKAFPYANASYNVEQNDSVVTITLGGNGVNVDVHAHTYTESITTSATCTTTGVKTFRCSCGDTYTETIDKLGHSATCGHSVANVGDVYYESIKDAIDNAESGTITLVDDVTYEGTLAITNENIVIDLNGNNLVADGIVTFGYGVQIVDSGETKGLIDVERDKLVFAPLVNEETGKETPATSTEIVPVWNGEGYVIADVTDRYVQPEVEGKADNSFIIDFKPKFDGVAHSYVKGGETATGLTFEVRITGGDFDKTYTVTDDIIAQAYAGKSVRLNLINAQEGVTYTVQIIIKSECGLHYVGELGQYTYTVPADAE